MWIEEPTSPDDILGHAAIARAIAPIKVATGEHVHNRVMWKQLFQANAISYAQIDACRLASVNEVLAVQLLAARFGVPVCPHAGGVGLCELVVHLAAIDFVCVSGTMEGRVVEWVDHLHEHFAEPARVSRARYVMPRRPATPSCCRRRWTGTGTPMGRSGSRTGTLAGAGRWGRSLRANGSWSRARSGCIGAWTVRELVRQGAPVVALDRSGDHRRLRMLLSDEELARVTVVDGRHHRWRRPGGHPRRPRHHQRHPSGRPPGAVLPRRPGPGRPGERRGHRGRVRAGPAATASAWLRWCMPARWACSMPPTRMTATRSSAAPTPRRTRPRCTASTSWPTRAPRTCTGRSTAWPASGCDP